MTPTRVMASLAALARHAGGAEQLGRALEIPNLSDMLNPNNRTQLSVDTAVLMELATGDFRFLRAHAEECRHFPPLPMPDGFDVDAEPCMQTLAKTAKEFADLVAVVSAVATSGPLTAPALASVRKEADELHAMTTKLMAQLAAMHEAGKRRAGVI